MGDRAVFVLRFDPAPERITKLQDVFTHPLHAPRAVHFDLGGDGLIFGWDKASETGGIARALEERISLAGLESQVQSFVVEELNFGRLRTLEEGEDRGCVWRDTYTSFEAQCTPYTQLTRFVGQTVKSTGFRFCPFCGLPIKERT